MAIHESFGKTARPVIDVNVGLHLIARRRYLDGGDCRLAAVTDWVSLVIGRVVPNSPKLLALAEYVQRTGFQLHVDAELLVATGTGHFAFDGIQLVDDLNCRS